MEGWGAGGKTGGVRGGEGAEGRGRKRTHHAHAPADLRTSACAQQHHAPPLRSFLAAGARGERYLLRAEASDPSSHPWCPPTRPPRDARRPLPATPRRDATATAPALNATPWIELYVGPFCENQLQSKILMSKKGIKIITMSSVSGIIDWARSLRQLVGTWPARYDPRIGPGSWPGGCGRWRRGLSR